MSVFIDKMLFTKKTINRISLCFFLTTTVYFCIKNSLISDARTINNKQTFIEADFVKSSQNSFYASGNVIMRRLTMLVNADEIEAIKKAKVAQKETEDAVTNSNFNRETVSGDKDHAKYRFFVRNWAKIRTDDDNLIFEICLLE